MNQRGLAVPLVLITLIIFFILILVLSRAGSETYTQTALVNYSMHARFFSLAVVEEATTLIHERVSDPTAVNIWKEEVIQTAFNAGELEKNITEEVKVLELMYSSGFKDPTNPGGFQGGERVFDHAKQKLLEKSKVKLIDATVRFHNFKPIRFDGQNPSVYHDPRRYYRDRLGIQPPLAPVGDFFGFCTIGVKVEFGGIERSLAITRDMKITNNEPVARNYAFFAFGVPDPTHSKRDLNSPGELVINALHSGRIRIVGPYYVDVEGFPDGTGDNPQGHSYPGGDWDSYSFIPSPRGITVNGFLFNSGGVERPESTNGNSGISFGIGSTGGLSFVLSGDPGYKAIPEVQNYWAGSVPMGEQTFSISGIRDAPFQDWRGLIYANSAPSQSPSGDFNGMAALSGDNEARIEGNLLGNYNQMNFTKRHFCLSLGTIIEGVSSIYGGVSGLFGGGESGGNETIVGEQKAEDVLPGDQGNFHFLNQPEKSEPALELARAACSQNENFLDQDGFPLASELGGPWLKTLGDLIEGSRYLICKTALKTIPWFDAARSLPLPRMDNDPPENSGNDGDPGADTGNSDGNTGDASGNSGDSGTTPSLPGGSTNTPAGGGGNDFLKGLGTFAKDAVQICMHFYEVDKKATVPYYYSLHAPYSSKVNKFEAYMGILNDVMGSVGSSGAQKEGGLANAVGESLKNMSETAKNAAMGQNRLKGKLGSEDAAWAPDVFGVLPSNFKPMARTCSRHYENLEDHLKLTTGNKDSSELFMDGNIWVEELQAEQDLTYFGNATLFSAYSPGSLLYLASKDAKLGNVLPSREEDHLNLFYRNTKNPLRGGGMLELKGKIKGSVFSFQGIKPSGISEIEGNLVVELINKSQYGDGNHMIVTYNPEFQSANKKLSQWFSVSISPKFSGMGASLRGNRDGPADDGVGVILDSIGE